MVVRSHGATLEALSGPPARLIGRARYMRCFEMSLGRHGPGAQQLMARTDVLSPSCPPSLPVLHVSDVSSAMEERVGR